AASGSDAADTLVAPQLAVRARLLPWLALKGSAGRFTRVPTTFELFGDGAFILARPALRPEIAAGGDLGLQLDHAREAPIPLALASRAGRAGRPVPAPPGHAHRRDRQPRRPARRRLAVGGQRLPDGWRRPHPPRPARRLPRLPAPRANRVRHPRLPTLKGAPH